jgi:hypothetical protein
LDVVDGGPFFFEDVETDVAGHVDVWMVHWGQEGDCWCSVGIRWGKCKRQFKGESGVGLRLGGAG